MKILISNVIQGQPPLFEQVSRCSVYYQVRAASHICLIFASQFQLCICLMMLTQLENCAPICLSGHLSVDTLLSPVTQKPGPRPSICSTFQSTALLLHPADFGTVNISRRYCSSIRGANVKD